MGTVTKHVDGAMPTVDLNSRKMVVEKIIDFAVDPASAADVVQVLPIPKGAIVTKVVSVVLTAQGATCTATVGDGAGANSWDASINLNSTGGYYSAAGTDAYAHGKYYAEADTIDITLGHNATVAKVLFAAEYMLPDGLVS